MPTGWWWSRLAVAGLVVCALWHPAAAGERDGRRLAAELAVMRGDLALLEAENTPARHRPGLIARTRGGLSSLRLLVRQAGRQHPVPIAEMRAALARLDLPALRRMLDDLSAEFPLDTAFVDLPASDDRSARGRVIHEALCQGCHDAPDLDADLPARNLFTLATRFSKAEFVARLISGLRGTPATGLDNPFSDSDLAALYAFYRAGG